MNKKVLQDIIKIIENEPELPGYTLQEMNNAVEKIGLEEAMRITVRFTKKLILQNIQAYFNTIKVV